MSAAETRVARDIGWVEISPDTDAEAVDLAAAELSMMDGPELLAFVLEAAMLAGPWRSGACENLAASYALAPQRRPIAEALAHAFSELPPVTGHEHQQWWHSGRSFDPPWDRKFVDLTRVYGNGEFPWDGFWTVTDPPDEAHDGLVESWELFGAPISRWHLPVRADARIWQIDGPADWAALVERYPRDAPGPHSGWELPGPNQHQRDIERLRSTPGQHAVRDRVRRHVLPDWTAVRRDYDGIHLSWFGYLTSEGRVIDLGDGDVTMLRYWWSERTLWLDDAFGEPSPLGAPALSGRVNGDGGISVRDDRDRRDRDLRVLTRLLGRPSSS